MYVTWKKYQLTWRSRGTITETCFSSRTKEGYLLESEKLLIDLGMGTPVIAAIKKRIEDAYEGRLGIDNNKIGNPSFDIVDRYHDWYSQE